MYQLSDYLYKNVEVVTKTGRILRGEVVPLDGTYSDGAELGVRHHKFVEEVRDDEISEVRALTGAAH